MKRIFFLSIPIFLALLMVTGLSVFFYAQDVKAAPPVAPALGPAAGPSMSSPSAPMLEVTPTVTNTYFWAPEVSVSVSWDRSGCGVHEIEGVTYDKVLFDTGENNYLVGWYEKWEWEGNLGYEQPQYMSYGSDDPPAISAFTTHKMFPDMYNNGYDIAFHASQGEDTDAIQTLIRNRFGANFLLKFTHDNSIVYRRPPGLYSFGIGDWWYCGTGNATLTVYPILYGVPPESDCVDDYTIDEVLTDTIVLGDDEDGNEHILVEGDYYYLETSGGPWNDGSDDRYDLAASWDREDWEPLGGFSAMTCNIFTSTQNLTYTQMFFSAISETFYIRVNDTGVFTDNTGSMTYTLSTATYTETSDVGCDDYFTYDEVDDWIASDIVYANVQNGTDLPIVVTQPDEWFLLETAAGPWTDSGQGPSYEMDFTRYWSSLGTATEDWELMSSDNYSTTAVCIIDLEDGHTQLYFKGNMFFEMYGVRVHDQDTPEAYGDNSGTMGYNLYYAEIEYPPEPCEALYRNPVDHQTLVIYPDRANGYEWLGWWPQDWFVLQSRGGPWNEGPAHMSYFYDLQISDDGGTSWYDFADYPDAPCVALKDDNHPRIYIKPVSGKSYWFRVKDMDNPMDFTDNTLGPMYIDISTVEFLGTEPGTTCDDFTVGDGIVSGTVSGDNQVGVALPVLADDTMYALETWGGPWYDANRDAYTYTGQITQDGYWSAIFKSWYRLDLFPAAACVETVGSDHIRIFFVGDDINEYMVRPNAEEPFNPSNTGSLGYLLSGVTYEVPGSCEDDYTNLSYPIESGQIYAYLENGIMVGDILSGTTDAILPANTYRLDVFGGPWNDGTSNLYDTDISDDGGATWQPFDEYSASLCFNEGTDANGYWGHQYFDADGTQAFRLRVHDTGVYTDNTSSMLYMLHSVEFMPELVDPPDDDEEDEEETGQVPGWAVGCYEVCYRPTSIIQVSQWLEFGRCELMRWLSWCPWHTYALRNLQAEFMTREPFATAYAMVDVVNQVEAEVSSYEWGGECGVGGYGSLACEGGGVGQDVLDGLQAFATLPQDSPYNGGSIDLFPATSTTPYGIFCQHQMIQVVGTRMATGLCWGMNVVDQIGYLAWMQWIYDLSVAIIFIIYVYHRFLKS